MSATKLEIKHQCSCASCPRKTIPVRRSSRVKTQALHKDATYIATSILHKRDSGKALSGYHYERGYGDNKTAWRSGPLLELEDFTDERDELALELTIWEESEGESESDSEEDESEEDESEDESDEDYDEDYEEDL
jgi:hypothetical protein